MFLEKVKEIKNAEDNAAEKKTGVQNQVKQLLSKAHEDGNKLVIEIENATNIEIEKMIEQAEERAAAILDSSKADSKIEAVAQKVEATPYVNEAAKYIIKEIFSEWA